MENAFIFRLPDELLDDIICRATHLPENTPGMRSFGYSHSELYETLAALCLVCQRFNRLAKPYLYADSMVHCYPPHKPQLQEATRLIHRSCRENIFLWPLCKRLIIHYQKHRKNRCLYAAMDFVTWFTAAKSLVIFGMGEDERAWILLRSALEHMTGLTLLSLQGDSSYNLSIPRVVEILSDFKLEDIRTLHLEDISMSDGTLSWKNLQVSCYHARFEQQSLTLAS